MRTGCLPRRGAAPLNAAILLSWIAFDGRGRTYGTLGYVPADHPVRPSVASEKLLRAMLPQVVYSVRSERLLM